jgi:hypothetical protein
LADVYFVAGLESAEAIGSCLDRNSLHALERWGFKALRVTEDSFATNGAGRLATISIRQRRRAMRMKMQVGHRNLIQGRSALRNIAALATGRQHRVDDVGTELCIRRQALVDTVSGS